MSDGLRHVTDTMARLYAISYFRAEFCNLFSSPDFGPYYSTTLQSVVFSNMFRDSIAVLSPKTKSELPTTYHGQ